MLVICVVALWLVVVDTLVLQLLCCFVTGSLVLILVFVVFVIVLVILLIFVFLLFGYLIVVIVCLLFVHDGCGCFVVLVVADGVLLVFGWFVCECCVSFCCWLV